MQKLFYRTCIFFEPYRIDLLSGFSPMCWRLISYDLTIIHLELDLLINAIINLHREFVPTNESLAIIDFVAIISIHKVKRLALRLRGFQVIAVVVLEFDLFDRVRAVIFAISKIRIKRNTTLRNTVIAVGFWFVLDPIFIRFRPFFP